VPIRGPPRRSPLRCCSSRGRAFSRRRPVCGGRLFLGRLFLLRVLPAGLRRSRARRPLVRARFERAAASWPSPARHGEERLELGARLSPRDTAMFSSIIGSACARTTSTTRIFARPGPADPLRRAESTAGMPVCFSALRMATNVGYVFWGWQGASATDPRTPWLAMADASSFESWTAIPCGIDSMISRRTVSPSGPSTRSATPVLPDAAEAQARDQKRCEHREPTQDDFFIFVQGLLLTAHIEAHQFLRIIDVQALHFQLRSWVFQCRRITNLSVRRTNLCPRKSR